ncbi:TetR/AcrR family transcriptional regulator [Actinocrispum sp. NPDC049592]|uniref:TetR/AcrR family transcriptional regulator n=1 Tax=Actinocrispum sp. NPDC049592 TaxID=3154835 RepID=UPI0034211C7B
MPKKTDTRDRVLRTAATLFRAQGYHATGLNQVLAEGGAPKGSLYFHFPGGKEQLAVEALQLSAAEFGQELRTAGSLDGALKVLGDRLEASGFRDGCPVATVALDVASESDQIRAACESAYAMWERMIADALTARNVPNANDLAPVILAMIEGALLRARTQRSTAPLQQVGAYLKSLG